MLRVSAEARYWDRAGVEEVLSDALDVIEQLQPADDLRVPVFQQAAAMLSQKHVQLDQVVTGVPNLAVPRGQ